MCLKTVIAISLFCGLILSTPKHLNAESSNDIDNSLQATSVKDFSDDIGAMERQWSNMLKEMADDMKDVEAKLEDGSDNKDGLDFQEYEEQFKKYDEKVLDFFTKLQGMSESGFQLEGSDELITSDGITSDSQTSMSDIMRRDTIRRQRRDLTSSVVDIVNSIQSIRRKRYSEYPKYPQYPTYSGYMSNCQKFVQMLKDVMACPAPDQGYGYGAVNTSTYGYGGYTNYTIQCSPACNEKLFEKLSEALEDYESDESTDDSDSSSDEEYTYYGGPNSPNSGVPNSTFYAGVKIL